MAAQGLLVTIMNYMLDMLSPRAIVSVKRRKMPRDNAKSVQKPFWTTNVWKTVAKGMSRI